MSDCPCCSHRLLRHIRNHEIYWFCPHCRQDMPNPSEVPHLKMQSVPLLNRVYLMNALQQNWMAV